MVDTLLTYAQMIAGVPDNTTNLVAPADVRDGLISAATDAGEIGDGTDWVLALAVGVPSNINAASPAPDSEVLRSWAIDGNNALIPAWAPVVTPAGLLRGANIIAALIAEPAGVADIDLKFDLLKGATIASSLTITLEGGADASAQAILDLVLEPYEPFLVEPWSLQITNLTNSDDLNVYGWDLKITGVLI